MSDIEVPMAPDGADGQSVDAAQFARNVAKRATDEMFDRTDQIEQTLTTDRTEGQSEAPEILPEDIPAEPSPQFEAEFTDDIFEQLLDYGIDLGVPPSQVPPELKPQYLRMAESAVNAAARAQQELVDMRQKEMQLESFMQKIEQKPEDVLMLIALNNPDAFLKTYETLQRFEENPRERELTVKELELRAREEQYLRESKAKQAAEVRQRAQRAQRATQVAAQKYGVRPEIAMQFVMNEVKGGNTNITPQQIDTLIRNLGPSPRTMSIDKARKVQQTPTAPVGESGPPRPAIMADREPSPGLKTATRSPLRFRNQIRNAIRNFDKGE